MTTVIYSNINDIEAESFESYLNFLPTFMTKEVTRYRFLVDRLSRLLARLMLIQALAESGNSSLLLSYQNDGMNKPIIPGWYDFNIAHSGEWVVFCYSNDLVGIDIEQIKSLDFTELAKEFHPEENERILASTNVADAFYRIWVQKEAVLKALGHGITRDLNSFSCKNNETVVRENRMYFKELTIFHGYSCYISTPNLVKDILIKRCVVSLQKFNSFFVPH